MRSVNLQFLLNILDILDIKVWSLKKKLSVCDSILGRIAFFRCQKTHVTCIFFQDETKKCALNISIFCKKISMRGGQ
jgi:hypothetical protein